MQVSKKKKLVTGAFVLSSVALLGGLASNQATASGIRSADPLTGTTQTEAKLRPLNNAAASGSATVTVDGRNLDVSVDARRLLKGMPHAQHIHFGATARNECPTVRDDDNADHRIDTVEGIPAYGPVRVSLTKRGDTSPDSTLAVNRFPKANDGRIHYDREIRSGSRLAQAITNGKAVVVIHGIDYNGNGAYDFEAGESDLDPTLPAEATDPVVCGVLRESQVLSTP